MSDPTKKTHPLALALASDPTVAAYLKSGSFTNPAFNLETTGGDTRVGVITLTALFAASCDYCMQQPFTIRESVSPLEYFPNLAIENSLNSINICPPDLPPCRIIVDSVGAVDATITMESDAFAIASQPVNGRLYVSSEDDPRSYDTRTFDDKHQTHTVILTGKNPGRWKHREYLSCWCDDPTALTLKLSVHQDRKKANGVVTTWYMQPDSPFLDPKGSMELQYAGENMITRTFVPPEKLTGYINQLLACSNEQGRDILKIREYINKGLSLLSLAPGKAGTVGSTGGVILPLIYSMFDGGTDFGKLKNWAEEIDELVRDAERKDFSEQGGLIFQEGNWIPRYGAIVSIIQYMSLPPVTKSTRVDIKVWKNPTTMTGPLGSYGHWETGEADLLQEGQQ